MIVEKWCQGARWFVSVALILSGLFPVSAHSVVRTTPVAKPCQGTDVVSHKGLAYFCSEHKRLGKEVFVSNGGEFSSQILIDLDPGPGGSSPLGFFEHEGFLLFVAETTPTGWALWKIDEVENSVTLVRSLPGLGHSSISPPVTVVAEAQGSLYFQVSLHLFKTDGTFSGTTAIDAPITTGLIGSGTIRAPTTYYVRGETLYLMTDSVLFRVNRNGSSARIVKLPSGSSETPFIYKDLALSGKFVIRSPLSRSGAGYRRELWLSDGTTDGTTVARVDDTEPVGNIGLNLLMVDRGSGLLFSTSNGIDQTNIATTGVYGGDFNLTFGNSVSFLGEHDNGVHTLWITDGTSAGTAHLPSIPVQFGGKLIGVKGRGFSRTGESYLWSSNIHSPKPSKILRDNENSIGILAASSQGVFFARSTSGVGSELWVTDGTSGGTKLVKWIPDFIGVRHRTWVEGQRFYFQLNDSDALWHSDGTAIGTYALKYQYDDGLPPLTRTQRAAILVTIIDLLLE